MSFHLLLFVLPNSPSSSLSPQPPYTSSSDVFPSLFPFSSFFPFLCCLTRPLPLFALRHNSLVFPRDVTDFEYHNGMQYVYLCFHRPKDGGRYCIGQRKRYKSCNVKVSLLRACKAVWDNVKTSYSTSSRF